MTSFKSPEKIQAMFNEIAKKYDFMNNIISLGLHPLVKKLSVKELEIPQNAKILDLCTGTGDLAKFMLEIEHTSNITGIDFSDNMLKIAQKRVKDVNFLKMDCTQIRFENDTFDITTIGFGLRNIENPLAAINEIYRVTKKGGKFLHLDFGKSFKIIDKIFDILVSILVKIFYKNSIPYEYLIRSKQSFPSPSELISDFESAGFKFIKRRDFLLGIISCQIFEK